MKNDNATCLKIVNPLPGFNMCLMMFVYIIVVVVKQFQEYTEPGSGEDGTPQRRSEEEESVLLPLGDNTLTHNLGIPVVVVCTKVHAHRPFLLYYTLLMCGNSC